MTAVAPPADPRSPAPGAPVARAARVPLGTLPLLALGMSLARRGVLAVVSIAICASTALCLAVVAGVLASRGPGSPAHDVPLVASSALAWGGGFLLAFAAAAHALRRDRAEGIRGLFVARTTSLRGYLLARVGGLAALIALCVSGGTLLSGLVGAAFAARFGLAAKTLHATGAAVVFSIAFSAVVAPVAFAALGARSRASGYLFLIAIVSVPEAIVAMLGSLVPETVADVVTIPSALSALRTALAPGSVEPWRAARALVALAAFAVAALVLVRRDAIRVDAPDEVET